MRYGVAEDLPPAQCAARRRVPAIRNRKAYCSVQAIGRKCGVFGVLEYGQRGLSAPLVKAVRGETDTSDLRERF